MLIHSSTTLLLLSLLFFLVAASAVEGGSPSSPSENDLIDSSSSHLYLDDQDNLVIEPPQGHAVKVTNFAELNDIKVATAGLSASGTKLVEMVTSLGGTLNTLGVNDSLAKNVSDQLSSVNDRVAAFSANTSTYSGEGILLLGGNLPNRIDFYLRTKLSVDIHSPRWTSFPSLPPDSGRANGPVAFWLQGQSNIYIVGGVDPSLSVALSSLSIYNYRSPNPVWYSGAPMNTSRQWASGVALPDLFTFVITGGSTISGNSIASCEVYESVEDRWTFTASLSVGRFNHSTVLFARAPVVLGGRDDKGLITSNEILDVAKPGWSSFPGFVGPARHSFGAAVNNGSIYVFGGIIDLDAIGTVSNLVERYNGSSWFMVFPSMPTPRYAFFAVRYLDTILLIGGPNTTSIDAFFPKQLGWSPDFFPSLPLPRSDFGLITTFS